MTKNEKIKIFFSNSPNGSICKVNWLKSKFEHLFQNLPLVQGVRGPVRMIQKAKNEVFGHFLEFGLLDRLDIA